MLNVLSPSRLNVCQCSTLNSGMRTSCQIFFKFIIHYYPSIQHYVHGRSHRQHHKTELFSYLDYNLTIYTQKFQSTFPSSWSTSSDFKILLVNFIGSFIWCNLSDCKLSPYLDYVFLENTHLTYVFINCKKVVWYKSNAKASKWMVMVTPAKWRTFVNREL